MCISSIDALTSRSCLYSYRSWEYEKIDAIDPIDIIGATISYFIYGSFILKVGPLYSTFNSVWCARVRHSIDLIIWLNLYKVLGIILTFFFISNYLYFSKMSSLTNLIVSIHKFIIDINYGYIIIYDKTIIYNSNYNIYFFLIICLVVSYFLNIFMDDLKCHIYAILLFAVAAVESVIRLSLRLLYQRSSEHIIYYYIFNF